MSSIGGYYYPGGRVLGSRFGVNPGIGCLQSINDEVSTGSICPGRGMIRGEKERHKQERHGIKQLCRCQMDDIQGTENEAYGKCEGLKARPGLLLSL